jgi:hypothetical protein
LQAQIKKTDALQTTKDRKSSIATIYMPIQKNHKIAIKIILLKPMLLFYYNTPRNRIPFLKKKADAIVVVPATFNTTNKWAAGITDTLATGILCEAMGYNVPIVAVPYLKQQLAQHPVFSKNLALLRECGIHILYEPEQYPSPTIVPWSLILDTLDQATSTKESQVAK